MVRRFVTVLIATGSLAGVSVQAETAHYQSNPYLNYSCKDLIAAATDVSARAERDSGVKNDTNPNNTDGEFIVLWPKAFFATMDGEKATDLSHLKQEMISIEQASIEGQCEIQFDGPRPPGA
jgi:hypothetical protein